MDMIDIDDDTIDAEILDAISVTNEHFIDVGKEFCKNIILPIDTTMYTDFAGRFKSKFSKL